MTDLKKIKVEYYNIPDDALPQTRWLLNIMNNYNVNCAEIGRKIHVARQTVRNWVHGYQTLSFPTICALVYIFDKAADPEKLYQLFNNPQQEQSL